MKSTLYSKFSLFLIVTFAIVIIHSQAQERVIIKLDGRMTPVLDENFGTHKYNQVLTTSKDSTSISKIYDLKNRLLIQTREKYNGELGYNQAIISNYDTLQNQISSELKNIDNGSFVKVFFDNEKIVSRLAYFAGQGYKFYLGESKTPTVESIKNPMEVHANYETKDYNSFLVQNLKYPPQARDRREMGTVILKLDVNEAGEVLKITCLNEDDLYKPLITEAIRVVKGFDPNFIAPIDLHGNKTSSEVRIPIRFKLN